MYVAHFAQETAEAQADPFYLHPQQVSGTARRGIQISKLSWYDTH